MAPSTTWHRFRPFRLGRFRAGLHPHRARDRVPHARARQRVSPLRRLRAEGPGWRSPVTCPGNWRVITARRRARAVDQPRLRFRARTARPCPPSARKGSASDACPLSAPFRGNRCATGQSRLIPRLPQPLGDFRTLRANVCRLSKILAQLVLFRKLARLGSPIATPTSALAINQSPRPERIASVPLMPPLGGVLGRRSERSVAVTGPPLCSAQGRTRLNGVRQKWLKV